MTYAGPVKFSPYLDTVVTFWLLRDSHTVSAL